MVYLTGTGLYTPTEGIDNDTLVHAFNAYVDEENARRLAQGLEPTLAHSSAAFIEKASGIRHRYVMSKEGILDPKRMRPLFSKRDDEDLSYQVLMAKEAALQALQEAKRQASDVDVIIMACSNFERPYPAMAIELQQVLGAEGYAYDMNVACSSASFGLHNAYQALLSGGAKCVLVVNPEICSGHLNFKDRDSHFIFGDACTAMVLENKPLDASQALKILATRAHTKFSNAIRNNAGFLFRTDPSRANDADQFFYQQGRRVYKEVSVWVSELMLAFLKERDLSPDNIQRFWLHQANAHMNDAIAERVFGFLPDRVRVPIILDTYANTSSAGSVIAMHQYKSDLQSGDRALLASFGAGYSCGMVLFQR